MRSVAAIVAAALVVLAVGGLQDAAHPRSDDVGANEAAATVRWFGALRAMMHEGKTASAVQTSDVVPGPHTYAVGALSELRGEITIVDDEVWYSRATEAGYRTSAATTDVEGAALLVAARVESWDDVRITRDLTQRELEDELAMLAAARGLDGAPFAFRLEALFPSLDVHVVDGRKIKPGTSPREHHAASIQMRSTAIPATLVGFYSDQHQGVFTHHGETTHIHAVLANPLVTGHVDDVLVPKGAILKLPRVGR